MAALTELPAHLQVLCLRFIGAFLEGRGIGAAEVGPTLEAVIDRFRAASFAASPERKS